MAVVKKAQTKLEPSLVAMCKELGLSLDLVADSLEAAERLDREEEQKEELVGTPGHVLRKFAGSWDMTDEEWDEIYRDIKAMREMTE
ncbi:MAG: hypothetical protein ABFE07_09450 [Armatimonadia bacterium]